MDWNNTLQNIDFDSLTPSMMEWLTSTFTEELENRVTQLEQIDDRIHTDRDGYIRRFVDGWSQICESSSVASRGLNLGERVSQLEGSVHSSLLYPRYSPYKCQALISFDYGFQDC